MWYTWSNAQKKAVIGTFVLTLSMGVGVLFTWRTASTQDTQRNPAYSQPEKLIKLADTKEIYGIFGDRKHLLQNPTVFASYGYTYDEVEIVSEAALQQYPLIRLVQVPNETDIYYLNYTIGRKKAHPTYEVFLAYGNTDDDVIFISPTDRDSWPDVELIRDNSNGHIYLLENGRKRYVPSMDIFNAYGFVLSEIADVIHIDAASYPNGESLPYPAAPFHTTPVATERIIVTAAPIQEPREGLLVPGTMFHEVAAFTFTAPLGAIDAEIRTLTITKQGLAPDAVFFGIELFDEQGLSLVSTKKLQNQQATFRLPQGTFTFKENTHRTVTVVAHLNPNSLGAFTDSTFTLLNEAAIVAELPATGAFPLSGPTLRVMDGEGLTGKAVVSIEAAGDSQRSTPVGSRGVELLKLTVEEMSGREGLAVEFLTLKAEGSTDTTALENIVLVTNRGVRVRPRVTAANRYLHLDFGSNPLRILSGGRESWTLEADIVAGSGRTISLSLENRTDIRMRGVEQGFILLPTVTQFGSGLNTIAVTEGGMLFYRHTRSAHGDVPAGTTDVALASFVLLPVGEEVTLDEITIEVKRSAGAPSLTGDIIVINERTKRPVAHIAARGVMDRALRVIMDEQRLLANSETTFSLKGDMPESAVGTNTYQVVVSNPRFTRIREREGDGRRFSISATVTGNYRGIKNGLLIASSTLADEVRTVPVGKDNVTLAVFTLQAGAAEAVHVRRMTLDLRQGMTAPILQAGFKNIEVVVNNRIVSRPQTLLGFPITLKLNQKLKAGGAINVAVRADVLPPAEGETVGFRLVDVGFTGTTSGEELSLRGLPLNSDTISFDSSTVTLAANLELTSPITVVGGSRAHIASYTLTSEGFELQTLHRLVVTSSSDFAEFSYLRGYHDLEVRINGKRVGSVVKNPLPEQNIMFSSGRRSGSIVLGANAITTIDVYITTPTVVDEESIQVLLEDMRIEGRDTRVIPTIIGDPARGQVVTIMP